MKKIILVGLTIVLFTACQNQPVRWTATSPEIDVTKALVKDYLDGNWESWMSHYATDAKIHHNSIESISSQQLQDSFKESLLNYNSYTFSDKDIFYEMIIDDEGDKWVYFWGTWEAKVKETNKELVIPVHLALKFVDNKIVEEYGYYDTSPMIIALQEMEATKMVEEVETTE